MASYTIWASRAMPWLPVMPPALFHAGLEMMDGPATRAIDRYLNIRYDTRAEAILLLRVLTAQAEKWPKIAHDCRV